MKKLLSVIAIILMMDNILTPFYYAFGDETDIFSLEENVVVESESVESDFSSDDSDEQAGNEEDSSTESQDEDNQVELENTQDSLVETQNDENNILESEEQDFSGDNSEEHSRNEEDSSVESENEENQIEGEDVQDSLTESQDDKENIPETQTGSVEDLQVDNPEEQGNGTGESFDENQNNGENVPEEQAGDVEIPPVSETEVQTGSEETSVEQLPNNEDDQEEIQGILDALSEEVKDIVDKIRYFFKRAGDSKYLKYGRDENNIGIITLRDPKTSTTITIMDRNLGATSVGLDKNSYGYYFQWGNNNGVMEVNSSNKTTKKAVYEDRYYNHGYDGQGLFIVGSTDYWESGAHYNSLRGSESKEFSRQGACPTGYRIPTIKEWNQLLSIWGKIHTQDESINEIGVKNSVLRYTAKSSTSSIHTFKDAATQCEQGDTECVDEDKLISVVEILSSELKLPLAGSYDENGSFHDGLGVYWTTTSRDGNKAGVFNLDAYIGGKQDETLLYKAQGHSIRCFQNVEKIPLSNEESVQEGEIGVEQDSLVNNLEEQGNDVENESPVEVRNDKNQELQEDSMYTTGVDEYTITWKNEDGTVIDTTQVAYGEMPTHEDVYQPADVQYSYEFKGRNPEITETVGNAEYTATYTYVPRKYTITWKNEDGTVIDTTSVAYGEMPTHKNATQPADDDFYYEFKGWSPKITETKGNAEYTATYTYVPRKYTITWKNEDGTIRDTTQVVRGEIPIHEDITQPADEHYTYVFNGWEPEIREAVGDTEYRVKYTYVVNQYNITWENEDGTELKSYKVEYGTIPTYDGKMPEKQSDGIYEYSFDKWEPEISEVTGDMVYIAKYNAIEPKAEEEKPDDNILTPIDSSEEVDDGSLSGMELNESNVNEDEEDDEVIEMQDSLNDDSDLQEENQGFWGGMRETLKSFFLEGDEGYLRGSEIIENVTVTVEAEEGTFPEGTEVVIKGVPQNRLETIQTSLIEDETNNVTEDAQILAFDISFVYSGEEIQPTKEVSVKFNYQENSDFQGASVSELSVYHIDDETDEGQEVEVVSKDGDEIEILATDFSVYVLTLSNDNTITLTLDPGDGTIITGDNIVVDEQGIGTITSVDGNVTLPNATRDNHVFVGWYTSQTSSLQSFAGNGGDEYHVNTDITLYAKWCNDGYTINTDKTICILEGNLKTILDQNPNFTWGEKEIPMPLGWTNEEDPISIVMMDRNLGASTHGTESNAWGYYYQWGNNYGFTQNPPTIRRDTANVNLSLYAPSTYYSGTYIIGKVDNTTFPGWATTENYNIWGYYSGTNEAKQGPCPTNWHVPTIEEWNKVVEYWSGNNGGMNVPNFRAELGLPLAGGLTRSTAALESGNIAGFYRTVTPNTSKTFAYDFLVKSDSYDVNYSENLVNGRQVRCFKNEDAIVREYTVTYTDGVEGMEIFEDQIFSGLSRGDDFPQFSGLIPSRTGNNGVYHEFLGWFLEGTEIAFNISGAKVIENVSLYAMWTGCPDGEEANALGFCVPTAEEQRNRQIVQDLELYLLASDQNKIHYTIMDRNMGATEVFNKYYDSPNPASLGYLYQWGNNYGFPAQGDLAQHGVFIRTSQVPKNIWSTGIPSNYASGTYYSNAGSHVSWMGSSSKTDGIWGGTGDTRNANGGNTTLEARQGPCPVGYHVPSTLEWTTIFMDWSGSNIGVSHAKLNNKIPAIYKFSEDLLLPPAGRRGPSGALDYISALSYWSSSPATSDAARADGLYAKPDDKIEIPNADGRSRARSVRCVKNAVNTSATSISTDDIHLDGGGNAVISIDNWVISTLGTPTRVDSTFNGWYTTSDFSGNPLSTGDTVSAGSSLYAKFTCNESGYVWNGTSCEDGIRLYFDSMGGTEVPSQLIESGMTGTRPADPTKTGYVFNGWYLTGETENEFNFTGTIITEETTVYAHWNTGQYEVSIVSNNVDYGTVDSGSIIADYGTPISTNENELTIGFTTVIATPATSGEQYTYTFSGWTFENCGIEGAESVTTNCEITANFDRISNGYTVTWNNSDGTTLETDLNVPYGTMPSYDGETPTSGGDAQYSYTFIGWSPATGIVQGDVTYTATYTQSINEYTVIIQSSDVNSGTVTTGSITVPYGTNIFKSGNILEIGSETSIANPNPQTWQYDFAFVDWTNTCGVTVTTGCEITANFESLLKTYTLNLVINTGIETIYYKINGADNFTSTGVSAIISGVEAGSEITAYAQAKSGYTHIDTSESNPWTVTVTGDNLFSPVAVANSNTQYTVYHYVKIAGESGYELSKTELLAGTTDEILILSSLTKEFLCAHYGRGSLTGNESGPGEEVTQTTIKGDGSTKIYLYYIRNSYTVTLSGDAHVQSLEGDGVRECGSERPINATPKPGYHFVRWDKEERREGEENEGTPGE